MPMPGLDPPILGKYINQAYYCEESRVDSPMLTKYSKHRSHRETSRDPSCAIPTDKKVKKTKAFTLYGAK